MLEEDIALKIKSHKKASAVLTDKIQALSSSLSHSNKQIKELDFDNIALSKKCEKQKATILHLESKLEKKSNEVVRLEEKCRTYFDNAKNIFHEQEEIVRMLDTSQKHTAEPYVGKIKEMVARYRSEMKRL